MTDKDLANDKYNKFSSNAWDNENIECVYQKSFTDENGLRKYFLTWRKWNFSKYSYKDPSLKEAKWEGNTQLEYKKNGQHIDITFLNGWNTEDAEEFLEKLFETGWFKKYDE